MTIIQAVKKLTPSMAARRPEWPEHWALRKTMFGGPVLFEKEKAATERLFEDDYTADDWEMLDLLADKGVGFR